MAHPTQHNPSLPPLWHETFLFTELVEQAVKQFPRYYKYTLGQELRHNAMRAVLLIDKAVRYNQDKLIYLAQLIEVIDELKLQLQVAKQLQALHSYDTFAKLTKHIVSMGKQSGGWYKRVSAK